MMKTKKELRAEIRKCKKRFTDDQLRKKSEHVVEKLLNHEAIVCAHTLMMYASLPDEVYTLNCIETLYREGKQILLPEVVSDTEMRLRVYQGPDSIREGHFHIMEPTGEICPEDVEIDVAIVPGMAFDHAGHRLGHGKGYYDRFLSQKATYKIGLCFDFQLMDSIPSDPHDVVMDEVINL